MDPTPNDDSFLESSIYMEVLAVVLRLFEGDEGVDIVDVTHFMWVSFEALLNYAYPGADPIEVVRALREGE